MFEANPHIHTRTALARGEQLAQLNPSSLSATVLMTAIVRTEISRLVICNVTSTAATARVFHDDDGSTYSTATAILYDISVPANTSILLESDAELGGLTVAKTGTIGVRSGTINALCFTAYGSRETVSR